MVKEASSENENAKTVFTQDPNVLNTKCLQ